MQQKKRQQYLLLAAVLAAALWFVPVVRPLLLPLVYLNTHVHELAHAIMGLGTGGGVGYIKVMADGSGVTTVGGGIGLLITSAGYVGSAVAGALLLISSKSEKGARTALWTLGIVLITSMVAFVRGDLVGLLSGAFWCVLLPVLGKKLSKDSVIFAAQFLGIQQCFMAFHSLSDLFQLSVSTTAETDAAILAQSTGIPAIVWAVGWSILGVIAIVAGLKVAWHEK